MKKIYLILILLFYFFTVNQSFSEVINEINIKGNSRVSDETIIMFSKTSLNDEINSNKIN